MVENTINTKINRKIEFFIIFVRPHRPLYIRVKTLFLCSNALGNFLHILSVYMQIVDIWALYCLAKSLLIVGNNVYVYAVKTVPRKEFK